MSARKTSIQLSDLVLLSREDIEALLRGETINADGADIRMLPSVNMWGADIAAHLDHEEWRSRPDLW